MSDKEIVVQTEGLTKTYGKIRALDGLNLSVYEEEVFGYLGPNGAGKSTTIKLLMDFIRPTKGNGKIFGLDINRDSVKIKEDVGYMPDEMALYGYMTGDGFLNMCAGLNKKYDGNIRKKYVERLQIPVNQKIRTYSMGTKQKLLFVQSVIHNPKLLILDEPTKQLDPLVKNEVLKIILEIRGSGCTVIMSSHNLSDVERICDRVGIIKKGRLAVVDALSNLKLSARKIIKVKFSKIIDENELKMEGVTEVSEEKDVYTLKINSNEVGIMKKIVEMPVEWFNTEEASLDDIFMGYFRDDN